jgi:hypothetical protein
MPRTKQNECDLPVMNLRGYGRTGGPREVTGIVVGLWCVAMSRAWNGGLKLDVGAADC